MKGFGICQTKTKGTRNTDSSFICNVHVTVGPSFQTLISCGKVMFSVVSVRSQWGSHMTINHDALNLAVQGPLILSLLLVTENIWRVSWRYTTYWNAFLFEASFLQGKNNQDHGFYYR